MWLGDIVIGITGIFLTILVSRETLSFNLKTPTFLKEKSYK